MAEFGKDRDDVRSHNQVKCYPSGGAQGGVAIQAVSRAMGENDGTTGYRTIIRETSEGRAIARTRDGMPMVEVGGGCAIGVDHGAVDMLGVHPASPDIYKSGNLYRTDYVAAHIVAAGTTDPDAPIVDEIEPPETRGDAPADGAVAKSLQVNNPPTLADALYAKKLMMASCPSSVFTGRTRLWVQALYGLHDELSAVSLAATLPSATPALVIKPDDSVPVWITTNTGVYLDPVTADHWMISVTADEVKFYPMATSGDCIESLREHLLDPAISDEDKERIETYLLADSTPNTGQVQTVAIATTPVYSMGYGWHFNWAGDTCDIVVNATISATPDAGYKNESTHYRLSFSKNVTGKWQVSRTIVEGPTYWKNYKHDFVVCEPVWDEMIMYKFGAVHGPAPFGNAPIYVFYERDTLRTVRYSCTSATYSDTRVSEPLYFAGTTYGVGGGGYCIGFDDCSYEDTATFTGLVPSFSCGAITVTGAWEEKTKTGSQAKASGYNGNNLTWSFYCEDWRTVEVRVGYPTGIVVGGTGAYAGGGGLAGLTHGTASFSGPCNVEYGNYGANGTGRSYSENESIWTRLFCVVPFYDAEAVYLYSMTDRYATRSGYDQVFDVKAVYAHTTSTGGFYAAEQAWQKTPTSQTGFTETESDRTNVVQKLVSSSGTHDFTLDTIVQFFSESDTVDRTYSTVASASGNSLYGSTVDLKVEIPTAVYGKPFAFVGWA